MSEKQIDDQPPKRRKITTKREKTVKSELDRFNSHQFAYEQEQDLSLSETAPEVSVGTDVPKRPQAREPKKSYYEMPENKKVITNSTGASVARLSQEHHKKTEEIIPLPPREKHKVYTVSKPMGELKARLEAQKLTNNVKPINMSKPETTPAAPTFNSFEGISSFEEIFNKSSRYFKNPPKRGNRTKFTRIPRNVSARHIGNVLWIPYHKELGQCCAAETGTCQSMTRKLRHPLKEQSACMAYKSEVQLHAFYESEEIDPLASESDLYWKNPICLFCYRYYITKLVNSDSVTTTSSNTVELAEYYHLTGVEGEYKQEVCFQNQGGNLRGINGNVVIYNPDTFVPVVGVIDSTNPKKIARVMDIPEYEEQKELLGSVQLAYGWCERGVFFKQNNNTVPECADINPYIYSYSRVKNGPLSALVILRGYFANRTDSNKYTLFEEFGTMVSKIDELWTRTHPLTTPAKIQYYKRTNQVRVSGDLKNVWTAYHVWQHVCLHQVETPPAMEECRIYYMFLYVINGLIELDQEKTPYPAEITKKLKWYISSFSKMQTYYKNCEGDYRDSRFKTIRVEDQELNLICSSYFSCYPRLEKIGFNVHEYIYLEFERITLRVKTPDQELTLLYESPSVLHEEEVFSDKKKLDHYLNQLKKTAPGAYHALTQVYNRLVSSLRVPKVFFNWLAKNSLSWPQNTIASRTPSNFSHRKMHYEKERRFDSKDTSDRLSVDMEKIIRKLFKILSKENKKYKLYRGLFDIASRPFRDVLDEIKEEVRNGRVGSIFEKLSCDVFSYLLPDGYVANQFGINFVPWTENTVLLCCLVRVHILEQLINLENLRRTRERHLLTLMRNSHIPLVNVICELPHNIPFRRNDSWVQYMSLMPNGGFICNMYTKYCPSVSYLDAFTPYSDLSFHEGKLADIRSVLTQTNYFFDAQDTFGASFLHPFFRHKTTMTPCVGKKFKNVFSNDSILHCTKTTIGKLSKKKNASEIIESVDFGSIIPKRNFLIALMKCSFLGTYEHALVKPSFKISTQLLSLLENCDTTDIRELFDGFTSTCTIVGDAPKKLKFEKILNDIVTEYMFRLQLDTPIQEVLVEVYGLDPTQKSSILMDFIRLGIQNGSLAMEDLYNFRQKNPIKMSQKLVNHTYLTVVEKICKVILKSDEPRYAGKYKQQANIPKDYQITDSQMRAVHAFIDKLSPTATIYAEELEYIGMDPNTTLPILAKISQLVMQPNCDISKPVDLFESLELTQSSLVAYFFTTLNDYFSYGELVIRDLNFVDRQEKVLKKIAGIEKHVTEYTLPKSIYHTLFSPCCNTWNGLCASSQFYKKEYTSTAITHYSMPHGNQAVVYDLTDGEIYCKPSKKSTKKKKGNARDIANTTNDSGFFTVSANSIERNRVNGQEPTRLNKIRVLERRKTKCGEIPAIEVNLRGGRIVTTSKKVRHPFYKRITAQYNAKKSKKAKAPSSFYQPLKSLPLSISNPPYTISPCCGIIRTTGPQCWGVNGYYCGACLPKSNIEFSIIGEILCFCCRSVVANTGGTRCPLPDCKSNRILEPDKTYGKSEISCTHGASPVYVVDDLNFKPVYAYFCDTCYKEFDQSEPGLVSITAVIEKDAGMAINILDGKELSFSSKRIIRPE